VTTDAAIAVGNLDAQIDGWEQARARRPGTIDWWLYLASAYGARGRALGRIGDYETALALADEAVRRWPDDGEARLARAAARATGERTRSLRGSAGSAAPARAGDGAPGRADGAQWAAGSGGGALATAGGVERRSGVCGGAGRRGGWRGGAPLEGAGGAAL